MQPGTAGPTGGRRFSPGDKRLEPLVGVRLAGTDPFAENSPADAEDFHRGVDLACAEGTPVLAAMDGVVLAAERSASYGNYIRLCHADGVETLYAHLQYLFARPGEVVRAGQVMGTAGQTGRATGPHLHFELLDRAVRCDPSALLGLPA